MKEITDDMLMDQMLEGQIPEAVPTDSFEQTSEEANEPIIGDSEPDIVESAPVEQQAPKNPLAGKKLSFMPGDRSSLISDEEKEESMRMVKENHITRAGENIFKNAEIREGWIPVDKQLMGLRAYFYPEDWQFRIRPATVEAIRNWSNVDENNFIALDDIFNEVLKSCISIVSPTGQIPWGNICSWDRFYFLLLIREYTFLQGEHKLNYSEDCPECDNPVEFELTSNSLLYEFPDEDIIKYYDINQRCWIIDPEEYEVAGETIHLYVPTLEKDANIKAWLINRVQENNNRKFDQTFMRFLPWMAPKFSKDIDVIKKQIKSLDTKYKSWDMEMFSFMDEVLKNIAVTPKDKLIQKCPICGEEVTAAVRFPNTVNDLFAVQNKHRKFGSR